MQKSHPNLVNPKDIAGELGRRRRAVNGNSNDVLLYVMSDVSFFFMIHDIFFSSSLLFCDSASHE